MTLRPDPRGRTTAGVPLGVELVYLVYFASLGASEPYLSLLLQHRGLTPSDAAYLLALLPAVRVVATPAWTALADAWRSSSRVLQLLAAGAVAAFAPLAIPRLPLAALVLALVAFTATQLPAGTLIDVLALDRAARSDAALGRLRAWGTAGYTLAAFAIGLVVRARGPAALVPVTLGLLVASAAATQRLPAGVPGPSRPRLLRSLRALLGRRRFVVFLVGASLHQVGLAAYDALFVPYAAHVANAAYAGAAVALGTTAEVLFLARAGWLVERIGSERTLLLAYAGSALRWTLLVFVRHPVALVLVQALHALTFGAFYLGAVALVDRETPAEIRASGQGLFATVSFGLAASASLLLAGRLLAAGGMPRVFLAAACASALATLVALSRA